MRLTVTSLEDRTVPAGLGGLGFGLGLGLGHALNHANPADLNKLLTDEQAIVNRQVPDTQVPTLLSDAQTLATKVPAAVQTKANTLVTTIQTAETDGQISRQENFNIQSAAQSVLRSIRHNSVPRSELTAIRTDLKALNKAFEPTAADRSLIRSDLKTIRQDTHFQRSDFN